jgi:hypothetical protein
MRQTDSQDPSYEPVGGTVASRDVLKPQYGILK